MYTTTINFPVQKISPTVPETIQLILEFTHNTTGSNVVVNAIDQNLRVMQYGEREVSYDMEEALLVSGTYSLVIGDANKYLDNFFFGSGSEALLTDKQVKVIIKINGNIRFVGNAIEETIKTNSGTLICSFNCKPKTDVINKKMAYADDYFNFIVTGVTSFPTVGDIYSNNASTFRVFKVHANGSSGDIVFFRKGDNNPLTSGTLTRVSGSGDSSITYTSVHEGALNPFSYNYASDVSLVKYIEDIYKLLDPSISFLGGSLLISHDWLFKGEGSTDGQRYNGITLPEIYIPTTPVYFNNTIGVRNCGEVLKQFAFDFCAMTGVIGDKAFFKKLFSFDPNNTQTVKVYSWEKGYRYGLIDYVKISTDVPGDTDPYEAGIFTELENRSFDKKIFAGFYSNNMETPRQTFVKANVERNNVFYVSVSGISVKPTEGSVYSYSTSTYEVVGVNIPTSSGFLTLKIISGSQPPGSNQLTKVSGSGDATINYNLVLDIDDYFQIYQVKDASVHPAYINQGDLTAKVWYHYRGNIQNCRVDKFTFLGVDYDYLKDFIHDSINFQPIMLKSFDSEGITVCEAIYLGGD
jgi:hypothetical protein